VKTGVSSFEHVFEEPPPEAVRRRRWPFVVAALAVAVAAGATIAVLAQRDGSPTVLAAAPDAGADARGQLSPEGNPPPENPQEDPPADAGIVVDDPPGDGGPGGSSTPPAPGPGSSASGGSSGSASKRPPRDGRDPRDGRREPRSTDSRREITVQILTYPEEGTVYRGRTYRGPAGTTVVEPYGTVARFTCTKVGYKEGYVDVKFDDKTPIAVCVMSRKKLCVDDLKNPYDQCPDAGAGPSR
jgi:hypothetical protein